MKTIKSFFIGALVALMGSSAIAANRTSNQTIASGASVVIQAPTGNVSGTATTGWSESSNSDPTIAAVIPVGNSSGGAIGSTRRPYAKIVGLKVGTTKYVMKNDEDSYTWTINVTVTAPTETSYTFKGKTINAAGATKLSDNPLILRFDGAGTLASTLPMTVDYLVIGGGGSGGSGRNTTSGNARYGDGGSGGSGASGEGVVFPANTYTITVGNGGWAVTGTDSAASNGKAGSSSSIAATGFTTITAAGGAAGASGSSTSTAKDGNITSSQITGSTVNYAQKGALSGNTTSLGAIAAPSTGNGGGGGGRGGTSGAGGSGVVIVKITDIEEPLEFEYEGVNFTTFGATTNYVNGELVMTFTRSGSMETDGGLSGVQYLVVGGGGSGGTGYSANSGTGNSYKGSGGGGAETKHDEDVSLAAGTYQVAVGTGGESVQAGSTGAKTAGQAGHESTLSGGTLSVTANGGAAGGTAGTPTAGQPTTAYTSNITGSNKGYGKGGEACSSATTAGTSGDSSGGPNTGTGGQGGGRTATAKSGAGADGVVVVRVPLQKPKKVLDAVTLYVNNQTTVSTSCADSAVAKTSSDNETIAKVASATLSGGQLNINVQAGSTTGKANIKVETDKTLYLLAVTVQAKPTQNLATTIDTVDGTTVTVTSCLGTEVQTISVPSSLNASAAISGGTLSIDVSARNGSTAGGDVRVETDGCVYTLTVTVQNAIVFKDQKFIYSGATAVKDGDTSLTLTYKSGTGSLTFADEVTADILAVGGGGGGGGCLRTGTSSWNYKYTGGNGGDAGRVDEKTDAELEGGTFDITVGTGGAGGAYVTSGTAYNGGNGTASTVKRGTTEIATGAGGNGGAGNQSSAADGQGAAGKTGTNKKDGKTSSITGTTYGTGGSMTSNGTSGQAGRTGNTGNGGNGAGNAQNDVGQGGDSGLVIIRITDVGGMKRINVVLEKGSSVKWTDVYKKGSAGTTYALDKNFENGVTAETTGKGVTALTTLSAAKDAAVGATATFTVTASDGEAVTAYNVTVADKMRIAAGQLVPGVAENAGVVWGRESVDEGIARLETSGSAPAGTANLNLRGIAPGETTLSATNAAAKGKQAFGWNVQVYRAHSRTITLDVGGSTALSIENFGGLPGDWEMTDPGSLVKVTFDEGMTGLSTVWMTIQAVSSLEAEEVQTTFKLSTASHEETITVIVRKAQKDMGSKTIVIGDDDFGRFVINGAPVAFNWTAEITQVSGGTVSLSKTGGAAGETLEVSGRANSTATVKITNGSAVYTYTVRIVPKPYPVKFCQGDHVRIWYHNTVEKDWFLVVNDDVVKANTDSTTGREMRARVSMEYSPNQDAYLDAWAENPGSVEDGDLIVVSDGENYYTYRMSVAPERAIAIGEEVTMDCSTVATNVWFSHVDAKYAPYVSVTNAPNDKRVHTTRAYITGLAITDAAYVEVSDEEYHSQEVNAQGALYTLKVKVVGAPHINVHLVPGAGLDAGQGYPDGTDGTAFAVLVDGESASLPVTKNGITFWIEPAADGKSVISHFTAASDAPIGPQTTVFTVTGDGNEVVTYVADTPMGVYTLPVGMTITGALSPAPTPWVTWSLDERVATAKSIKSGEVYTGEWTLKYPGDFQCRSTNETLVVGYWGSLTRVYDMHTTDLAIEPGDTYELDIENVDDLKGIWSVLVNSGLVNVEIVSENSSPVNGVRVRITTSENKIGTTTATVRNDYHAETLSIYVGPTDRNIHRVEGGISVVFGKTATLPFECVGGTNSWSAASEHPEYVRLDSATGAPGQRVIVHGDQVGTSYVTVGNKEDVYIYKVTCEPDVGQLEPITIGVGETRSYDLTGEIANATAVSSADPMIVQAAKGSGAYTVTGVQDGTTTLVVSTPTTNYYQTVRVHERDIHKTIHLMIGKSTCTTYSYTFDQLLSPITLVQGDPNRIDWTVDDDGRTLTFFPKDVGGTVKVDVPCYVDGLSESSTLHYTIVITKMDDGELEVLEHSGDDGYIAYKGASEARYDPETGDYILVFTNTADNVNAFIVPSNYTARTTVLAVGGGGGGGTAATPYVGGGAGGAGGYTLVTDKYLKGGTFCAIVGRGGLSLSSGMGSPLVGINGTSSGVTNAFGYAIASAMGGGGGAVPTAFNNQGSSGGSGGGGAWYNGAAGPGGRGIDGQGTSGGTPRVTNDGGGGGGAGGAGGKNGEAGLGKTSDITGEEVLYAQGGVGGKGMSMTPAVGGNGPGFGGDGGNNGGQGGSGANGVVVVRITDLYEDVTVPVPTTNDLITARFKWEDGKTCAPFDYYGKVFRSKADSRTHAWEDAIDHIKGTTNVVCQLVDGTNMVGIGYYNFTIYLKAGYTWDVEDANKATGGMRYQWTVVESLDNIDASISVSKTVIWDDEENATVRVVSESSPEISGGGTPNVLFLGGMCNVHGLVKNTIINSISAIAQNANVDWYLCDSAERSGHASASGYIEKTDGYKFTWPTDLNPDLTTSNHHVLGEFLNKVYEAVCQNANGRTYDYIVIEFDGTRLGKNYGNSTHPASAHEAEVAEALKKFYADDAVIWICDDWGATASNNQSGRYPWDPLDGPDSYYRPVSFNQCDQNGKETDQLSNQQWNALLALLDPKHYKTDYTYWQDSNKTTTRGYWRVTNTSTGATTYYDTEVSYWCADKNFNQIHYSNSDEVAEYLASHIKAKPFNLEYTDKILNPAQGLEITGVDVVGCTNEVDGTASPDPTDWFRIISWDAKTGKTTIDPNQPFKGVSMTVHPNTNLVTAVISNIDFRVWTKFDTHVHDTGTFRTSEGATYNQQTGKYEKNPNDGPVNISMIDNFGVGIGVEGEAETEVLWTFDTYKLTASAVNGDIYIAGANQQTLDVGVGVTIPVYYRGESGYRLAEINVGSSGETKVPVTEANESCYVFKGITNSQSIVVVYKQFFSGETSRPVTNVYDGTAHTFPVYLDDDWDPRYPTEIRYTADPNAGDADYMKEEDFVAYCTSNRINVDVGTYPVYYRIYAYQPGWGESITNWGWAWVDTDVRGSNTVTVTKRPMTITAKTFNLSALDAPEEDGPLNSTVYPEAEEPGMWWWGAETGNMIAGDTAILAGALKYDCPDYYKVYAQYPVYVAPNGTMTLEEMVGPNYEVEFIPGAVNVIRAPMRVGGVLQSGFLDPENLLVTTGVNRVVKQYDGIPTNLVVKVDVPSRPNSYWIKYSTDDGATWQDENPTFTEVSTNRVWYYIEGTDKGEEGLSVYFSVSNYNYVIIEPAPLTFTANSATRMYDGTELTDDGYELTSGELVEGNVAFVEVTGGQTDVGTGANVISGVMIIREADEEDVTHNYLITTVDGILTVTPAPVVINGVTHPLDPSLPLPWDSNGVDRVETDYSGRPTNITVQVDRPTELEGCRILYTTSFDDDAVWTTECPTFTDVGTNIVRFAVEDENGNYVPATNFSEVVIRRVALTVTADSATKPFDGTPLTASGYTAAGFADGEGIESLEMTAASAITAVGSTENEIDMSKIVWKDGTKPANYAITYAKGMLTVVPAKAPEEEPDDPDPYDPDDPKPPISPTNETGIVTLSDYDYTGPYDGLGHTLDTNALWSVIRTNEWHTSTPVVTYSVDGVNWVDDPYVFTNVVATSFWYKVSAANFSNFVHAAGVVITQRVATVTAASATWIYDEAEHSTNGFTTAGFVLDEGVASVTMTADSKIKEKGSVSNVIESVEYKANTLTSNYSITLIPGTLKVVNSALAVTSAPGVRTYDGNPTNIVIVSVKDVETPITDYMVSYRTVGESEWKDYADAANWPYVNVADSANVEFKVEADGYEDFIGTNSVTILAAPIGKKTPTGTDDNPGDEPAEGGAPTVWARNIVKCYDGLGTNVTAKVYNAPDGNSFTYEYSTNGTDFVAWEALQFTNVVAAQQVWYTAVNAEGNYLNVTNYAYVTITQRVITAENGIAADPTNIVYGASAPSLANHTWTGPEGLVEGDGVKSVAFAWTNETVISSLPAGTYEGFITTNAVAQPIVITNSVGADVTANYTIGFVPGALTVKAKQVTFDISFDPTDEFAWDGVTDWYRDATNNLVVKDDEGNLLVMGADYACVEVEGVDIQKATLKIDGIGNYAGNSGATNFWVTGYEVVYDVEGVCETNLLGGVSTTEVFAELKPVEGYAVDGPHSKTNGYPVRVGDGERLRLVVKYGKDSNGDGVPDRYQRMLTFRVINGAWDDTGDSAPRFVWITKYNADGEWDENGSNTLSSADVPAAGTRPVQKVFVPGGLWWPTLTESIVGLTVGNATPPLFVFGYNHAANGGSSRPSASVASKPPVFRTEMKVASFSYVDGKATFVPWQDVSENDRLVVSMPMEDALVTVEGKKDLEDGEWTTITTLRTNGQGYVTVSDVGEFRFFRITTTH